MKSFKSLGVSLVVGILAGSYAMPAAEAEMGPDVAGIQLEKDRRDMERERVREQIAEDEAAKNKKVEQEKKSQEAEAEIAINFELRQVTYNSSEILTPEEIHAVTAEYIGRKVTVKDLQAMAEKITSLYQQKGYMTCGAVLPPQRIHEGVVEIRLIEGKTGGITITGNQHTRAGYITDRLGLKSGEVTNTDKLNRDLRWFHGTNDVQLRVVVKPGKQEGTTDYEIIAFEPQNQTVTLYMDNDGYDSSGRWRQGIFYTLRSLTGSRDVLRATFLRSQGTRAWSLGYSVPISQKGMRLELDYSANKTEVTNGELKPFGVEGKSTSYSLTWRVPFQITEHSRHEAGLQYAHQTAKTEAGHGTKSIVPWVDDKIQRIIPYVSFTHYGDNSVFYHKHSFVFSRSSELDGKSDTARIYRLNSFWQKRYQGGQFLQARLDGQWSSSSFLTASSNRFFIGGVNSVRGYEEGFIGGERGLSAGVEYHIPLDKARYFSVFPFFDWGTVAGDTAPEHRTLMSAGFGFEARYRNCYSTLTVGFPLKKDFYEKRQDSARIDFSVAATF